MLRIFAVACAGFIISLVALVPTVVGGATTSEYIMRMATIAPEESYWGDFAVKGKFYLEQRSRGRIKMTWYMSGVMGDEPEIVKKIRAKDIQGGVVTITGIGVINPALRVLTLPFLFESFAEVDYILDSMFPTFQKMMRQEGFELVAFTEVGFGWVFSRNPIASVEDCSRMKMWTWKGEDLVEAYLRDLGFTTLIPTTVPECKAALERGLVDAFWATNYVQPFLEWYRHAKYVSDFWIGYSPAAIVFDADYFQSLPVDIQNAIRQGFDLLAKPLREIIRQEEETARKGLIMRGVKVYHTPRETLNELKRRAEKTYFLYTDKQYPRELLMEMLNRLKDFRTRQAGAAE